jgi:hypothetical protein
LENRAIQQPLLASRQHGSGFGSGLHGLTAAFSRSQPIDSQCRRTSSRFCCKALLGLPFSLLNYAPLREEPHVVGIGFYQHRRRSPFEAKTARTTAPRISRLNRCATHAHHTDRGGETPCRWTIRHPYPARNRKCASGNRRGYSDHAMPRHAHHSARWPCSYRRSCDPLDDTLTRRRITSRCRRA